MAAGELKDIGNLLKLRETIDPNYHVSNHIRDGLSIVEILPTSYTLHLANANKKTGQLAISFDDETGSNNFKEILSKYNVTPYDGVRLWTTDETTTQDEISHTFDENLIEKALSKISGHGQSLRQTIKSVSPDLIDLLKDKVSWGIDKSSDFLGEIIGSSPLGADAENDLKSNLGSALSTAGEMILDGKQVSLPRVWTGTNYLPTLNSVVKLVSPFGSPKAIAKFIIEPLIYMICLAAPKSSDGLTYGTFTPVRVRAYGVSNMNLACIKNITLRRGGRDTSYNVYKQPLTIDINIVCEPLTPGFAAMVGESVSDIATFDDADTPCAKNPTSNNLPGFTTVGNMIESLRPAPAHLTGHSSSSASSSSVTPYASSGPSVPTLPTYRV